MREKGGADILYVKSINSEWKLDAEVAFRSFKERCESLAEVQSKGSAWSYLSNLTLSSKSKLDCYSHDVSKLINAQSSWRIILSNSREKLAVLQDSHIEIRSSENDFTEVLSKWAVPTKDLFPQWRHLSWAPCDSLLAFSDSSGNVFLYSVTGNQLSHIPSKSQSCDLGNAACCLIFKERRSSEYVDDQQHWTYELLVPTYQGNLTTYIISQEGDHRLFHTFSFEDEYPRGIIDVVYLSRSSLLLVGGGVFWKDEFSATDAGKDKMLQHGISTWRVLSGFPYYKHVTDYDFESSKTPMQSRMFSSRRWWWPWSSGCHGDKVFKMVVSPDCKVLVTLHTSECICIWNLPNLHLIKKFMAHEQPYRSYVDLEILQKPKKRNAPRDLWGTFYVVDLAWWSNKDIIICRESGSLTISTIENLTNRLGSKPEFFASEMSLMRFSDGCFYILECQKVPGISKQDGVQNENEDANDEPKYNKTLTESDEVNHNRQVSRRFATLIKKGLYYITDLETFQPNKKMPKAVRRTFRLICLKSTTPEELYSSMLDGEEYGEALMLARKYNLDCDLTYQRQWKKFPVTVASIEDYLRKITNRSWVLHECLETVPENLDAMDELLKYGLRGTDLEAVIAAGRDDDGKFVFCECNLDYMPYDESEKEKRELERKKRENLFKEINFTDLTFNQRELCRVRLKLLQFLDKLETYQNIMGGKHKAYERYNNVFFKKFRRENIVESAVGFARLSDVSAIHSLFTYHGEAILPHRLAILSSIPESTQPHQFENLLPRMSTREGSFVDWETVPWRGKCDWSEKYCSNLNPEESNDLGEYLYKENMQLPKFRGRILTDNQLTEWYRWRSLEIEKLSGQVDCARAFIELGVENNVQGLTDLLDDLCIMETLVYECQAGPNLTFDFLLKMSALEKICWMMVKTSQEMFVKNIRKWVVPFLKQQESRVEGSYFLLLKEYLAEMAVKDLSYVELVFNESRYDKADPIIFDASQLFSIASECLYAYTGYDQVSMIRSIIQCLPEGLKYIDVEKDTMSNHLLGVDTLKRNGIEKTLLQIRNIQKSETEIVQVFTRMARTSTKKCPPMDQVELRSLLADMVLLQESVFTTFSKTKTYEIFVAALLCSGVPSHISLAGTTMQSENMAWSCNKLQRQTPSEKPSNLSVKESATLTSFNDLLTCTIDKSRSECLVLEAAAEYFNSSPDILHENMKLARTCLELIKDRPQVIQDELNLIDALAMLKSLGVSEFPANLRVSEDRLKHVREVLKKKNMMYKNYSKLLELGRLLKVGGRSKKLLQGQILNLIAQHALEADDYNVCLDSCKKLMVLNYGEGWEVCRFLGEDRKFQDCLSRASLLNFALIHSPDKHIDGLLESSAKVHIKILCDEATQNVTTINPLSESLDCEAVTIAKSSVEKALGQSKHVFTLTKVAFDHIGDANWWSSVVASAATELKKLAVPKTKYIIRNTEIVGVECTEKETESYFLKQTFPSFYEILYSHISDEGSSEAPNLNDHLLKIYISDGESFCEDEKNNLTKSYDLITQILLQSAQTTFSQDTSLGISYLLELPSAFSAEEWFNKLPKNPFFYQLAIYFFALRIVSCLKTFGKLHDLDICTTAPNSLVNEVLAVISQQSDWPKECQALIERVLHYISLFLDHLEAETLKKMDRGIDISRFVSDEPYKKETICGMALSLDNDLLSTSLSLAKRYHLPTRDVYVAHLGFLFEDSSVTAVQIEERIRHVNILEILNDDPMGFSQLMEEKIFPLIHGQDLDRLLAYYSCLSSVTQNAEEGVGGQNSSQKGEIKGDVIRDDSAKRCIMPHIHVKMLKKFKNMAPGLNYKDLVSGECDVEAVMSTVLDVKNVATFAKFSQNFIDKKERVMNGSFVYKCFASKIFNVSEDRDDVMQKEWVSRYKDCTKIIDKLLPGDLVTFVDENLFGLNSIKKILPGTRRQILGKILKFTKQQFLAEKQEKHQSLSMWKKAVDTLQNDMCHLDKLQSDMISQLVGSDNKAWQQYATEFDITRSKITEIKTLLRRIIIAGESIEFVDAFIKNLCPEIVRCREIFLETLAELCSTIKQQESWVILKTMKNILSEISKHVLTGGTLINIKEVTGSLKKVAADPDVNPQLRLELLALLKESSPLGDDDRGILYSQTCAVLCMLGCHNDQLLWETISDGSRRVSLFNNLLESHASSDKLFHLVQLLNIWPPMDRSHNLWYRLITKLINNEVENKSGTQKILQLIIECIEKSNICDKEIEQLADLMTTIDSQMACKIYLSSSNKSLYGRAIIILQTLQPDTGDSELFQLLLKQHMLPKCTHLLFYPKIIDFMMAYEIDKSSQKKRVQDSHLSEDFIQSTLKDLVSFGQTPEAGTIYMAWKSVHKSLRIFNATIDFANKFLNE